MATKGFPAKTITVDRFKDLLSQYPALIESLSAAEATKPGQKALAELDEFRYGEAVELFSSPKSKRTMNLEDVKALLEWKLRHGESRPFLRKLVSSNDPQAATETIAAAIKAYRGTPDVPAALAQLTKLKGIGPATASLLLAVHDPDRVIFFSDEAFWWLCRGGRKDHIKYNTKEYDELDGAAQSLIRRLGEGVRAVDVEKVAYVVVKKSAGGGDTGSDGGVGSGGKGARPLGPAGKAKAEAAKSTSTREGTIAKRKKDKGETSSVKEPTRRSKRIRAS